MRQEFKLPDVGEGLTEAEILSWRVKVGDQVSVNQILVEIETAKAAVELPSPYAGTVLELLAEPGATVEVGSPIIVIGTEADEPETGSKKPSGPGPEVASAQAPEAQAQKTTGGKTGEVTEDGRIATLVGYGPKPGSVTRRPRRRSAAPGGAPSGAGPSDQGTARPDSAPPNDRRAGTSVEAEPSGGRAAGSSTEHPGARQIPLAKPPVRKLARELGVDLSTVRGSGPNGVITREDVQAHSAPSPTAGRAPKAGERRVPIRGVRKATAQAMVSSAFTAPHVTEFLTVDVTPMIELRDRLLARREFTGIRLTPLVFAAKAVCLAMRRTPELNASWDDEAQEIVYRDHIHLGIAVATSRGLVVPKIRDADTLSLRELAEALTSLTTTAREGKTPPADMLGGTFTITNVGVFGVDTGTPIINPGEAGILALGAVKQAPWVVDGELAVRTVCQLALSFDHRLVDGEQGSRFLADVGALLADPGLALTY